MSETVEVNVLIYARDRDHQFHAECAEIVRRHGSGGAVSYLLWPVLVSYVRLVTNPRITPFAPSHAEAVDHVERLISRPSIRVVGPGAGFWPAYRRATQGLAMTAKLVADAQLVAIMYEHGVGTIWTRDRDFRKFDDIRVRDPLRP